MSEVYYTKGKYVVIRKAMVQRHAQALFSTFRYVPPPFVRGAEMDVSPKKAQGLKGLECAP